MQSLLAVFHFWVPCSGLSLFELTAWHCVNRKSTVSQRKKNKTLLKWSTFETVTQQLLYWQTHYRTSHPGAWCHWACYQCVWSEVRGNRKTTSGPDPIQLTSCSIDPRDTGGHGLALSPTGLLWCLQKIDSELWWSCLGYNGWAVQAYSQLPDIFNELRLMKSSTKLKQVVQNVFEWDMVNCGALEENDTYQEWTVERRIILRREIGPLGWMACYYCLCWCHGFIHND